MPHLKVLGRSNMGFKLNRDRRVLRRSKMLGQEGSGVDQVVSAAQKGIEALLSLGSECKLACSFKHIFNKERRQSCKCLCASTNPTVPPPPGVDCLAQYGISITPPTLDQLGLGDAPTPGTGGAAPGGINTNTLLLIGGAIGLTVLLTRKGRR